MSNIDTYAKTGAGVVALFLRDVSLFRYWYFLFRSECLRYQHPGLDIQHLCLGRFSPAALLRALVPFTAAAAGAGDITEPGREHHSSSGFFKPGLVAGISRGVTACFSPSSWGRCLSAGRAILNSPRKGRF